MIRRALFAASRSDRARELVTGAPGGRRVVDRFVAGEAPEAALAAVRALTKEQIMVTVDRLGEGTTDAEQARHATEAYLRLLDLAEAAGLGGGLDLSIKLSAVGQAVPDEGRKIAYENVAEICSRAAASGATVTVDMEDHTTTDATLDTVAELRRDFPTTGAVVQAYLRRSEGDCRRLATAGSRVRRCKGAYREPVSVAYQGPAEVRAAYARCLGIVMAGPGYPMVATHDPTLIRLAGRLAERYDRPRTEFEYQMLFGVRPQEQRRLAGTGAQVRVYVPYGPDWYGYLVRRLAERPANLMLLGRALASRR
jgi:proline dehydrogenase